MMRSARGFTLIELLVVIGIIVILIGILIPAIAHAKLQAKKSAVLGSLHGIGTAMATYETEWNGEHPTNLTDTNQDGRAFGGLALMAYLYHVPPQLFINPNTTDTVATVYNANGWPVLADISGAGITINTPASIDATNINAVNWHCSFSYDHELKRSGDVQRPRVYLGDRADYKNGRSISANWNYQGMCLLWTDQHAEFSATKSMADQMDPNIYHHNQYYDDNGNYPGEGATEVFNGISVTSNTLDTHLRFFSENEDNALLPNE